MFGNRLAIAATAILAGAGLALSVAGLTDGREPPSPQAAARGRLVAAPARAHRRLPLGRSRPLRIAIPAIRVHSRLLRLGLNPDGTMETPRPGPDYDRAGWYRYSPTPGQRGPAVIVGHVDSAANGPSVFYRLGAMRPGERIAIRRADGTKLVFRVDAVRRYGKARFPTAAVYGNTKVAALRLITCGGSFDAASGHYRDNTVVFAHLARVHRGSRTTSRRSAGRGHT